MRAKAADHGGIDVLHERRGELGQDGRGAQREHGERHRPTGRRLTSAQRVYVERPSPHRPPLVTAPYLTA